MELSNSNIKTIIFLQKKTDIIFQKFQELQKFLILHGTEVSYISENRSPKKLLIFEKYKKILLKNFLYFGKEKVISKYFFLAPSLKSSHIFSKNLFLYFGEWNFLASIPKNQKILTFLQKKFSSHFIHSYSRMTAENIAFL